MRRKSVPDSPALPERLRYLQPFRTKFASRSSEKLNEDSGPAPLMALLSERIHGLSLSEAEEMLAGDFAALQDWLAEAGQLNDPLHFALGFSLIATPAEMAKMIKQEAETPPEPKLCLHMELPAGAKLMKVPGGDESGMLVRLKGVSLAISANSEDGVAYLAENHWRSIGRTDYSVLPVTFGLVTGRKLLITRENPKGFFKEVAYALAVPGGHVYATLTAIGKKARETNWDEAPFEATFHTLRVETKLPGAVQQ